MFFKKNSKDEKPKNDLNVEALELSKMLTDSPEDPIIMSDFFNKNKLDGSVESLKKLNAYLEAVRKKDATEEELMKVVMRVGAYVGEVIKKQSEEDFNWYDYDKVKSVKKIKIHKNDRFGAMLVLHNFESNSTIFPLVKVIKYLQNGKEDDLYYFAEALINIG